MEPPQAFSNIKGSDSRSVHVLAVPYPSQGHVAPFMKLSHRLADHGVNVTFLITDFIYSKMVKAMPELDGVDRKVRLVSVPDGLEHEDDRKDETKLVESIFRVMPSHVEEMITMNNTLQGGEDKISCVIADPIFGWALEIAEKMELKRAMFWPSAPGALALAFYIPRLIEAGIINTEGISIKNERVQPCPNLPPISTSQFTWSCPNNLTAQKAMFKFFLAILETAKLSNWILCNWFDELNPSICDLDPKILLVGPLLAKEQPTGNFWSEDSTCLSWLDKQPAKSVIYVAFGSILTLTNNQFEELASGLELLDRPYLWVIRSDLSSGIYPEGSLKRVAKNGYMVQWAPQEKVLAHPSIACYLTHCGWNSIMEGLSNGVPFLCWPYCTDQFYNQSCVCDGWKLGLSLDQDENGVITRHEIKRKVELLLDDGAIKGKVLKMKELARESVSQGGASQKSLKEFVEKIRN